MTLSFIQIQNVRNIQSQRIELHPHLNIIEGLNGSGKTSFLESIYLLSCGHSFRTREASPLINHQASSLTVFSRRVDDQTVSIQKSISDPTIVRLNNGPCFTSSELASFLPCQVFYQDIFEIIDSGPTVRRSLLDWGLFHVKHDYHFLWKNYRKALKQRNALLRQAAKQQLIEPWNIILDELAVKLDQYRCEYFDLLNKEFQTILPQLTSLPCMLHYYKGWDRKKSFKSLYSILIESYQSDIQRQYTQYGAHQADLFIDANDTKIKKYLSRGQQKIILFALKLAQISFIEKPCLLLCDDLTSELDKDNILRLFTSLIKTPGQIFISCVNSEILPLSIVKNNFYRYQVTEGVFSLF